MSKTKKTETIVETNHKLEEFFDIERGSTEVVEYERETTDLVEGEGYDDKDNEIEEAYQEIFDCAMEGFDAITEESEKVPNQYKARMSEVALQHLSLALNAAKNKGALKQHKDKLSTVEKKVPESTVNNNIIISRNDLLKQILDANDEALIVEAVNEDDIIDAEVIDSEENETE